MKQADLIKNLNLNKSEIRTDGTIIKFIKEYGPSYLMLAPNFILFAAFTFYPVLWAIRYIFYDYDGISQEVFVGMENFIRAFTRDPVWWQSVANTFIFAFGKLVIEIPFALVLAVILNTNIKAGKTLRGIYFLPSVTSTAVISLAFFFMFSPYNGIINGYLREIGLINANVDWLGNPILAMISCMTVSIWQFFGQNMLLIFTGLKNIPSELYESARVDGAKKSQCFRYITLPMLAPIMQIIIMLAIIGSLQTFDSIYVITGGGPNHKTEVMAITIFSQFFTGDTKAAYGYGASLGFLSSIIIGIITAVYLYMTKKMKSIY